MSVRPLKRNPVTGIPRQVDLSTDELAAKGLDVEGLGTHKVDRSGTDLQFTDPTVGTETPDSLRSKVRASANDSTPGNLTNKLAAGTGITITEQNDSLNESLRIDADPSAIDHGGLSGLGDDDHPQYLNETRHDALPADNPHSVTASQVGAYTTSETDTEISDAITDHEAAADPHPQYETSAEAQAKVDAHANLTNNPHEVTITQAIAEDAGTDITTSELENLSDASNADSLHAHDHGNLAGLSDDDHLQYLTEGRHDALPSDNPHSVTITQAIAEDAGTDITVAELEDLSDGSNADSLHAHDHGALTGLGDDDHTQYTRKDTLTTKGDIYVRNSTVPTRLGVGSNLQRLEADSSEATGVKWVTDDFGRNYQKAFTAGVTTISTSTFTTIATITTPSLPSGNYIALGYASYLKTLLAGQIEVRFLLNGTTEYALGQVSMDDDDYYFHCQNMAFLDGISGVNTIALQFSKASGGGNISARNRSIAFWRVS